MALLCAAPAAAMAGDPVDIEQAKKDLAKIDRDLRPKEPVPDLSGETPYGRDRKITLDDAYVGSNPNYTRSYIENPDGTIYYIETLNGRTTCKMTGAVAAPSGKGGGATPITCPDGLTGAKKY